MKDQSVSDSSQTPELTAFMIRAIRFSEGAMSASELADFDQELQANDRKLQLLAELQLQGSMIRTAFRHEAYADPSVTLPTPRPRRLFPRRFWGSAAVAVSLILIATGYIIGNWRSTFVSYPTTQLTTIAAKPVANLSNSSKAKFFGDRVPAIGSPFIKDHQYVLTDGMLEILFVNGVNVILESPAIFRINHSMLMTLDAGQCSVVVPMGAEGFEVKTPITRVVDRGTRFMVDVSETSGTVVSVIEGAADLYTSGQEKADLQLRQGLARQVNLDPKITLEKIDFDPEEYRWTLPDRITQYSGRVNNSGEFERLDSITVQRGGILETIPFEELNHVSLQHFHSGEIVNIHGHVAGNDSDFEHVERLLSDRKLNSGIINPGGSQVPPLSDPDRNSPGLSVQFATPVVNHDGPDIVLFELQCFTNLIDGDAFYVSPTKFKAHHKTHLVKTYDLSLASPEARRLPSFSLKRFNKPIVNAQELIESEGNLTQPRLAFHAIAVSIDLSDLGMNPLEQIDALFFQGANVSQDNCFDPVFIAGLPAPKKQ